MEEGNPVIGGKPKKPKKKKTKDQPAQNMVDMSLTFQEMFGVETIRKDWTQTPGIATEILNQMDKAICWAIVLARLLQAIYNMRMTSPREHIEFSILELVDYIKPNTSDYGLANLRLAINRIAEKGLIKKPLRQSNEKVQGNRHRITENFEQIPNADVATIIGKLGRAPIGLTLENTLELYRAREGIFYVPMKGTLPTDKTAFHLMLIVGHGVIPETGELYLLGQNSWGEGWGFKGYIRIVLREVHDIVCLKE